MTGRRQSKTSSHWEAYWREAEGGAAVSGDAPGDLFDKVWRDYLERTLSRREKAVLADIACGVGVVLDYAAELAKSIECEMRLVGIDYAHSAAAAVGAKQSDSGSVIWGVTARAGKLPFRSYAFDLVVSQFGIEYADDAAFAEAARVMAPGGEGLFISHCKDGGIDAECRGNLEVLTAIESSGMFDTALDAMGAPEGPEPDAKIAKIASSLNPLLEGQLSASKQLLSKLLPDIARLVTRRKAYSRHEAEAWLKAMQKEVRLYKDRMKAMTEAALDEDEIRAVIGMMAEQGAKVSDPELLYAAGKTSPAAWKISFNKL